MSYLNISRHEITCLPDSIFDVSTLYFLDISNNKIVSIQPEIGKLQNLETIDMSHNKIISLPSEIGICTNLKFINLSDNDLSVIPIEFYNLTALEYFFMNNNNLSSLPNEIGQLNSITTLDLSFNNIDDLPDELYALTRLNSLYLSGNNLSSISDKIGDLTRLISLHISCNKISEIPQTIGQLAVLENFWFQDNDISEIPHEIINCRALRIIYTWGNPIEYISPIVARFLYRQPTIIREITYDDSQSVHKSSVQKSIQTSISALMKNAPVFDIDAVKDFITNDNILYDSTKQSLFQYSEDDSVHSILQITFEELLVAVWNRIITNDNSIEIKKILNTEMVDAQFKCFTGRISRLVNCLNGFDSDIVVKIDDSEQIGTIISITREQLENTDRYTVEAHKEIVTDRLTDLGYTQAVIDEWVVHIL